jgi:hypothetical protein
MLVDTYLVKKVFTSCGSRRFNAVFATARHWALWSLLNSIHNLPHYLLEINFNIILTLVLDFPNGVSPSGLPIEFYVSVYCVFVLDFHHHFFWFHYSDNILWRLQVVKFFVRWVVIPLQQNVIFSLAFCASLCKRAYGGIIKLAIYWHFSFLLHNFYHSKYRFFSGAAGD